MTLAHSAVHPRRSATAWLVPLLLLLALLLGALPARSQTAGSAPTQPQHASAPQRPVPAHARRSRQFLRGRHGPPAIAATAVLPAAAIAAARAEHLAMVQQLPPPPGPAGLRPMSGSATGLSATWQPIGPGSISSRHFGLVTGRVTSIAVDPTDPTGNTVYLGSTGGGVWKSANATGPAAGVTFAPLTDSLPVFSNNAGSSSTASLSIGALSVSSTGVLLAGTGDPNDATDSYYGSGLLRSTDGGLTWTLVQQSTDGVTGNHSWMGLAFAGFAWSTATPNLVVAALTESIEGDLVNAAGSSVKGLYYSTDAGATWQMSTIMDGSQTVQSPQPYGQSTASNAATSVVWDALRQRFFAAVRFHGYYQSADGTTWTRLTHQPATTLSLLSCPTNPGLAGNPNCPIFRGTLAVQPATGDLFALTTDLNNLDQGLWQDVCAASADSCGNATVQFGTRLTSTPLEAGNGSTEIPQADYNAALAALPSTTNNAPDTTLLVGAVDLYRCTLAAGCALRNTTNSGNGCAAPAMVAPAQHAIVAPGLPGLLFLGNDGGLWRSIDAVAQTGPVCDASDAGHFDNLNAGLGSLAETVSLALDPANPDIALAGFGAMGTAATTAAFTSPAGSWPQLSDGEGGFASINPLDPTQWTISTGAGVSLQTCANGGNCTATDFAGPAAIGPAQTAGDSSLFDAPSLLDPALPADMLVGTCRVWRGPAASGSAWSAANAISPPLAAQATHTCTASSAMIRSLAAGGPAPGAGTSQVLYAGMAGLGDGGGSAPGHLFATIIGGLGAGAWTDAALNPVANGTGVTRTFNPGGFDVSSVAVDPHDLTGLTVYATVMGFSQLGVTAPHLYRSIDGGSTWLNISRNLPNAPANSVVVDPNDANTVYIALDTGVYVTTSVTTCATANCWSVFGSGLPNAPVTQLAAGANLPTGDGRAGMLRAGTYGRGLWQLPLVTASFPARPAITVSPAALTFPAQSVGTASAAQTVTVTNTGSATLVVSRLGTTGDFAETDTCAGQAIPMGGSCAVQVRFLPTATGARSGLLTLYGNVSGGQATVPLSGTGTAAASIVLTPLFLNFPATTLGSTATVQFLTVSNTGGQTATLGTPAVTGDFAITHNDCGTTLNAQTGCTLGLTFTPTASGSRSGTLTLVTSAGTVTASLTGIGTAPATDTLAPLSLTFGTTVLNTASAAQTVTLTNTGDVALTLITAQITAGDFVAVNTCGNSLNGHSSCTISILFQPKNVGAETGALAVTDQYRTQTVALRGTGIAPAGVSLAPTSGLTFAATGVGLSSAAQTVTLTNNGGLPLTITSLASSGDFGMAPGGTCGTSLAAGSACTLGIVFRPIAGGSRTGALTITTSAANSPHTLSMAGTGVDFTLAANGSTSQTVSSGGIAPYPLLLSSAAGVPGTATLTCLGLPANTTCTLSPAGVALGGSTQILVNVATGVNVTSAAARPAPPAWKPGARNAILAGLPLGLLLLRRSRRFTALVCTLLMACVLTLSGCGAARAIPAAGTGGGGDSGGGGGGTTGTQSGTYTLTVNGTSAGLTRSVTLTLVVK